MTDKMGNPCPKGKDHPLLIHTVQVIDSGTLDILNDTLLGNKLEAQLAVTHAEDIAPLMNGTICTLTLKPINYMTLAKQWCF